MSDLGRSVVVHPSASRPPLAVGEIIVTDEALNEGLKKAADSARKAERATQTRARDAALAAQAEAFEAAHRDELARLKQDIIERERSAHAHGWHKATWMMGIPALLMGAVGGMLGVLASQNAAFDAGQRATRENVLTGTMIERMRGEQDQPAGLPPAEEGR